MTATRPETIRLAEDSTRAEIAEALTHLAHRASREFHVIGNSTAPSPWDKRHAAIDELLDQYRTTK